MNKAQAHAILNKCRNGFPMSLALTNEALERTGDISGLPSKSLCFDGDEQGNFESFTIHGGSTSELARRVGWSKYLDCQKNEGITQ